MLPTSALLWAEPDPFAPWLQLVMQGGALVVLLLLAFQAPKVIAALKAWRHETEVAHREERERMRTDAREEREAARAAADKAQTSILEHCEEATRRGETALAAMQKEIEYLHEAVELLGRPKRRQQPPPAQPPGGQQL